MERTFFILGLISLVLGIAACTNDEPEVNPVNNIEKFIGEYEINSTHISGIHTFHDSIGNPIGMGYDTTELATELLSIQQHNQTDTLTIMTLINSFNHTGTNVQGIVENDTIRLVYEFSEPSIRNDYIRGKVWLQGDSLFLNYRWDRSDTWSTNALPEKGEIEASGKLK